MVERGRSTAGLVGGDAKPSLLPRPSRLRAETSYHNLPKPIAAVAGLGMHLAATVLVADFDKIAPAETIARIPLSVPILILAGGRDERATVDDGKRILQNAPPGSATRFSVIANAAHLDLASANPTEYQSEIQAFLRAVKEKISGATPPKHHLPSP